MLTLGGRELHTEHAEPGETFVPRVSVAAAQALNVRGCYLVLGQQKLKHTDTPQRLGLEGAVDLNAVPKARGVHLVLFDITDVAAKGKDAGFDKVFDATAMRDMVFKYMSARRNETTIS